MTAFLYSASLAASLVSCSHKQAILGLWQLLRPARTCERHCVGEPPKDVFHFLQAQHLRSLAAGKASQITSAHLLRQTEAASAHQANWTEIAHSSSAQCNTIAVLQVSPGCQMSYLLSVLQR